MSDSTPKPCRFLIEGDLRDNPDCQIGKGIDNVIEAFRFYTQCVETNSFLGIPILNPRIIDKQVEQMEADYNTHRHHKCRKDFFHNLPNVLDANVDIDPLIQQHIDEFNRL